MDSKTQLTIKKEWQTPRIEVLGDITEVVLGGGGKLSITGGDTGENRKEKPHQTSD